MSLLSISDTAFGTSSASSRASVSALGSTAFADVVRQEGQCAGWNEVAVPQPAGAMPVAPTAVQTTGTDEILLCGAVTLPLAPDTGTQPPDDSDPAIDGTSATGSTVTVPVAMLPVAMLPDAMLPEAMLPDAMLPDAMSPDATSPVTIAPVATNTTVTAMKTPTTPSAEGVSSAAAEMTAPSSLSGPSSGTESSTTTTTTATATATATAMTASDDFRLRTAADDVVTGAAPVTTTAPADPRPVAAPATVPAPPRPALLPQLSAPVLALARAADGEHSVTLTISPETLGPVTVRAHISAGVIHLVLHAPSENGREALRAILIDLRRDLAVAAPGSSLTVSSDGASSDAPADTRQGSSGRNGDGPDARAGTTPRGQHPVSGDPQPVPRALIHHPSPLGGIDLYA